MLLLSYVVMLEYLREFEAAKTLQALIRATYKYGDSLMPDVKGAGATTQFADAIIRHLRKA